MFVLCLALDSKAAPEGRIAWVAVSCTWLRVSTPGLYLFENDAFSALDCLLSSRAATPSAH